MMTPTRSSHRTFAETPNRRVFQGLGETDPALRQRVAARAAGGLSIEAPFDDPTRQIGEAVPATTDA